MLEKAKAPEEEECVEEEGSWDEEEEEDDEEIEDYKYFGYNSEEEFLEDFLGCDINWTLDDFLDSFNKD